jgi:hypothetical protein
MRSYKCPICDSVCYICTAESVCNTCGFSFGSNRCTNNECNENLDFDKLFCSICSYESLFFLNSYDIQKVE